MGPNIQRESVLLSICGDEAEVRDLRSASALASTPGLRGIPGLGAKMATHDALSALMLSFLQRMLIHTQLPPHQHYQFSVLTSSSSNNGFCVLHPGLFLSNDNPWDTDCLILPEPNCGRDKERVKDVLAHPPTISLLGSKRSCCGTCHCQKGPEPGSGYMACGWDQGKDTCSTHPEPIPPSPAQMAVKTPESSPHFIRCLSCPPVIEM